LEPKNKTDHQQTGYKPRVLIFSTAKESSPDAPLTCLPDHTFGVRCVAFSTDSGYLASLGAANDGYLYVWKINNRNGAATLYASNKCTSNISQIAWIGKNLITVGTRHVKLWRVEGSTVSTPIKSHSTAGPMSPTSSLHRILYGRNCLLNDLIESTFTSVTPISTTKAIVCSDTGDICLLDDTINNQAFTKIGRVNFGITSSCLDLQDRVLLTGREGRIRSIPRKSFLEGQTLSDLGSNLPNDDDFPTPAPFLALAPFVGHVVAVDANRFIKLLKSPSDDTEARPDVARRLPAHGAPVLGVRPCHGSDQDDAAFFTWAADGTILFWTQDGTCKSTVNVELEQADGTDDGSINELRVVRTFSRGTTLVTGDKYGVLRSASISAIVILGLT
jgi:WD40 repeat protein